MEIAMTSKAGAYLTASALLEMARENMVNLASEHVITLSQMIHRCSAIGPPTGHVMTDVYLARNPLKHALGDPLHAVLCGVGQNIRMLMRKLWLFCA